MAPAAFLVPLPANAWNWLIASTVVHGFKERLTTLRLSGVLAIALGAVVLIAAR
jgi:hypothetical protein